MSDATQRRLAAIVSTDVVGYSRLIGSDETGTLEALRAHRAELIDPLVAKHGGRIVKTMGDGLLLEFPSVVNAFKCFIDVQDGMVQRNVGVSDDKRMEFRVGVNLGDIVIEGDDIYGDGVNVAARLQEACKAGGVALSGIAYDGLGNLVDTAFEDGGQQQFKNIARPVQLWRWAPNAALPTAGPATVALDLYGQSVLIVDDEKLTRTVIARILDGMGPPKVYQADHGAEALDYLSPVSGGVDFVIVDFNMPVMHGLDLLKAIRTGERDIRRSTRRSRRPPTQMPTRAPKSRTPNSRPTRPSAPAASSSGARSSHCSRLPRRSRRVRTPGPMGRRKRWRMGRPHRGRPLTRRHSSRPSSSGLSRSTTSRRGRFWHARSTRRMAGCSCTPAPR